MPDPERLHRVLVVDRDEDLTDIVVAILTDDGYAVATLAAIDHAAIAAAVGREEPDCLLLDSEMRTAFGSSWAEAAYLAARERSVPTIMFTTETGDVEEAREGTSDRAEAAEFAAVLQKPFDLDELLDAVAVACKRSVAFDRSPNGERNRSLALVRELRAAGATDIRVSNRREWATFCNGEAGDLYQLYWWQSAGAYIVGRYDERARLKHVGRFFERDADIAVAFDVPGPIRSTQPTR